ncbi:MAG: beta-glucuronidase [Tidjanibacter sp.]|nr:beta-glucuronidase [Tidjanibacter sp.]
MKKLFLLISALVAVCTTTFAQQSNIDLSGKWEFAVDREDIGENQGWFSKTLEDYINLPASMPEKLKGDEVTVTTRWTGSLFDSTYYFNPRMEQFRQPGNIKFPFFLTPVRQYVGAAWYKKSVEIPADWKGQKIEFYMERPHIESTVWVNGKKVGVRNSMSVAHSFDITNFVKAGQTATIAVKVDNRIKPEYNVGINSHSVTDQTQGNWNGIVGKIEIKSYPKTYFSDIQVYPELATKSAKVKMVIESAKAVKGEIILSANSFNSATSHKVDAVKQAIALKSGSNMIEMVLPMGDDVQLWDEFDPALYMLSAEMTAGEMKEKKEIRFGMREISIKDKYFYINGRQTLMRGTVECCLFPATGYAPMDVEAWIKVFRAYRNYGLNHMRFHSYCPPAAAFEAADIVGFYIQPEGPSWPNYTARLGEGEPIDIYLMDETKRISKEYGNSPSFCFLAAGNEPQGRFMDWLNNFVDYWKKTDSRRVYTGTAGWSSRTANQYHIEMGARGLSWKNARPETMSDFGLNISRVTVPYLSHETGQWCVFPNFDETHKYTGVNKAYNFDIFKTLLEENGMGELAHEFHMSSGKLQALAYKHEIEKTLRTQGYSGFQLLAINDYSGQGSALVGVTDVFYDAKEYISAEEWRRFCNTTVPLVRMPKFIYTKGETLVAQVEAAHFGREALKGVRTTYKITDNLGALIDKGVVSTGDIEIGSCQPLGEVSFALDKLVAPKKYNLEIAIEGTEFVNDWDFWVYDTVLEADKGNVFVTEDVEEAMQELEKGGDVLLIAPKGVSYGSEIKQNLSPVFWNTSWFKMRPPHTTGILVNEYHPAFAQFPTDYHSNLQWWELINNAGPMRMSDFPMDFQPLVQSIDTWFLSRKAGMLFEAKVLNGRLMMTTMDLTSDPENRIVARQMYKSLLDYMNGDYFRPAFKIEDKVIRDLYTKTAPPVDFGTDNMPYELMEELMKKMTSGQ